MAGTDLSLARLKVDLESRRYMSDIKLLENMDRNFSVAVSMYILCSSMSLPVKTVIVGERPYSTDIHPVVSSAMSYSYLKSGATPSSIGISRDLCATVGAKYTEVEEWVRESWRYIHTGCILVNCNIFLSFSSPSSLLEIVPFQKWLRRVLEESIGLSSDSIDVICMGVPSLNAVDSTLRSMGKQRYKIKKKSYPNPAAWSKASKGDSRSQTGTFGKKDSSASIYRAILRSRKKSPLCVQDYIKFLSPTMSAQVPEVSRLLQKSSDFVSQLEHAYETVKGDHSIPPLREAHDQFCAAMIEYRDAVLQDIVRNAVSSAPDYSNRIGKSTEWGSKKPWNKAPSSIGNSSRMSAVQEVSEGIEQSFIEDDATETGTATMETASELPLPEIVEESPVAVVKPKKTKIIRRRKVQKPHDDVPLGSDITVVAASDLRASMYYLADVQTDNADKLRGLISSSLASGRVESESVRMIVEVASLDARSRGTSSEASLGLETGEVDESCMLPKLLLKLCDSM